ncbi:MAG: TIM barrel protein [Planctomycetales bacterium]|nr:TIM barrel protein [Planctomycetales bacterium]
MSSEPQRREFLAGSIASVAALASRAAAEADAQKSGTTLGLVTYCCRLRGNVLNRKDASFRLTDPFEFLEHCHKVGAGGMQVDLGTLELNLASQLRDRASDLGVFVEAILSVPKDQGDLDRFTRAMQTAAAAGATAARTTIIPGRRYEYFDSLEMFREFETRGRRSLELAAPVAEKLKVPLAVENHKDHRNAERVALFEQISSEFVGACVDTGNSIALLEDPVETVEAFAPWAHSVHLKDQAVRPYADGFLLADIPLGQGCLDLKKMVSILRTRKPNVNFNLELITRDPLQVPTHSAKYWTTFPTLPAKDLARTLRMVRDHSAENLQYVSKLPLDQQAELEDANVKESLDYARMELGLR